jgi:hypothetical protein
MEGLAESPSCTLLQLQCFLSGLAHHLTVPLLRNSGFVKFKYLRLYTFNFANLTPIPSVRRMSTFKKSTKLFVLCICNYITLTHLTKPVVSGYSHLYALVKC